MSRLFLLARPRVLLPGQRLAFRLHDQAHAREVRALAAFGVVFEASNGEVATIGTEAEVVATSPASHDRLDVEVVGRRRFRVTAEAGRGWSRVDYLPDYSGPGDLASLRGELHSACRRYAAAAVESGEPRRVDPGLHIDPRLGAYQASMLIGLTQPERQELLEMPSTTDRLEWLLRVAAGETGLLRHVLATGRMQP